MALINALDIGAAALPGDGYPPLSAFTLPEDLRAGLVLAIFPGNGLLADFSPSPRDVGFVGEPVRTTKGYECSPSAYVQSDLADPGAVSVLILTRRLTPTLQTGYAGDLSILGNDVKGVGFWSAANGTSVAFTAGRTGVALSGGNGVVAATPDSWGLYLGRSSTSQNSRIDNLTTGASNENSTATGSARATNGNLRLGSSAYAPHTGSSEGALMLVWNRYLTSLEVTAVSTWAKAYAATLGITA